MSFHGQKGETMNQKLLIGNGTLITRDKMNPFIPNGGLLLEDGLISELAVNEDAVRHLKKANPDAEYMDARGMLVMPGYINAHHHCYSAFARGMSIPGNHPSDFLEILKGTWWKLDQKLDLKATYDSGIATFADCIRNGVTTVIDHHASYGAVTGSLQAMSEAADLLGIRTCLAYEISDRDGKAKMQEALQESFDFVNYLKIRESIAEKAGVSNNNTVLSTSGLSLIPEGMQRTLIGLHASFTLSDQTLALCRKTNESDIGYHIHVAEGAYDLEQCQREYNCTVVERLQKEGILKENTLAAHCIHITESDMDLIRDAKTMVVHNPQSNMGNAVGAPDVLTMLDKGILVCLGTDGYTSDMMESAKTAVILQRHRSHNPDRGFTETVRMLFENNAVLATRLFGRTIGVLKKQAAADIILVDYKPYTPLNEQNFNGHLFFGVNGMNTDTTIINGKVRMRNKKLLTDTDGLFESCKKTSARVWEQLYEMQEMKDIR